MWVGQCPTQQLFEGIWNPIFPKFSFIIILLISQSFFLSSLSLPQNEYQSFWKNQFYFLFFTNFGTLFFIVFIFSYSFFGTYAAPLEQVS
jgi:hypothetical protein